MFIVLEMYLREMTLLSTAPRPLGGVNSALDGGGARRTGTIAGTMSGGRQ